MPIHEPMRVPKIKEPMTIMVPWVFRPPSAIVRACSSVPSMPMKRQQSATARTRFS